MTNQGQHELNVPVEMILGAIAGAVGVWAMDRIGWYMYNHEDRDARAQELQGRVGGDDVEYSAAEKEALAEDPQTRAGKDVAHAIVEKTAHLTGLNVSTHQPSKAGIVTHFVLGILPGAVHAVVRRKVPAMGAAGGALYGFTLFVLNDEIAAPLLGIASGPRKYPWQGHVRGVVEHVTLGIVTELVLRLFDRARR